MLSKHGFSIHASAKEATFYTFADTVPSRFSIHASAKEATKYLYLRRHHQDFQSTPPRRRRPVLIAYVPTIITFQSTPPRRRRQVSPLLFVALLYFSIHASAKEATRQPSCMLYACCFQSTPPRRRRPCKQSLVRLRFYFQSTPPRRRRLRNARTAFTGAHFQSTPPRRRRPHPRTYPAILRVFNPRLREGGDDYYILRPDGLKFSIHASAKEATGSPNYL